MEWYNILLRIVIAGIVGLAIGYEREHSNHPAGVKTHIMVCIGAAVVSIVQINITNNMVELAKANPEIATIFTADTSRIIAQVVSGVGFIGAGCILHDRGSGIITGLTTASTLWLTACIGIAAGLGQFWICGISTVITVCILYVLGRIKKKKNSKKSLQSINDNTEE